MNIREEQLSDIEKVYEINSDAFGRDNEPNLVNALRARLSSYISLVADDNANVIGHIMFTPVELSGSEDKLKIMGLAPLAVLSNYQSKGVGSKLVQEGIERCKSQGYDAIVVLGHPNYYPKFGFIPSVSYGIKSEYEVSDEKFMVLELVLDSLKGSGGVIKYHDAFSSL